MPTGRNIHFAEDGEEIFAVVASTLSGCSSSVFIFFGSDAGFADFVGFLGVVFFPRDPPNRSDSISSRPCRVKSGYVRII